MIRYAVAIVALAAIAWLPVHAQQASLKVMQWNVFLGGKGTDQVLSRPRQVHWIAGEHPDILSMNEIRAGEVDEYRSRLEAATRTRWYAFHAVAQDDGIGNAILSRYRILSTANHVMETNGEWRRGVSEATIDLNGTHVSMFSAHLDNFKPEIRAAQMLELIAFLKLFPGPRILAGDLNADPVSAEIQPLFGEMHDSWLEALALERASSYVDNPPDAYTRTRGRRRIDYILHSPDMSTVSAGVPDQRDISNNHVEVFVRTPDDLGVRPSDHNFIVAVLALNEVRPAIASHSTRR